MKVLRKADHKDSEGKILWICECDCGNITTVKGKHLKNGNTKSCGCLQREAISKTGSSLKMDITGQQRGYLTAIREDVDRNKKSVGNFWICRCVCGNEKSISVKNFRNGNYVSCGCKKISQGEFKILEILEENEIAFEKEKTFDTCRSPKTNAMYLFDFYIQNKYIVEFDGAQHFPKIKNYKSYWDDYEKIHERDLYKNEWCKKNNIPLIRIPYTRLKDLCVEDLKLETSNYIVA